MRTIRSMIGTAALWLIWAQAASAAQDPHALLRMDHTFWTARDGAPQSVNALVQDPDGTLWVGADSGLFNFDGLRFRQFESPPGDPLLPRVPVESLLVTRQGVLWVGFYQAGAARIKAGRVTVYDHADQQPLALVEEPFEARDGSVWAMANQLQLIRFDPRDEAWHLEAAPLTTRMSGLFIDKAGTIWLVQGGYLHRRALGQSSFTRTDVPSTASIGFAETPNGNIWIHDMDTPRERGRTQLIDGQGHLISVLPFTEYAGDLVMAPDGSLIVVVLEKGVRRFTAEELVPGAPLRPQPDMLTREQGLSSNIMFLSLIDKHGNIWLGGDRGLDRLRPQQLTAFDEGRDTRWMVCATGSGELWVANQVSQLYKVSRGSRTLVPGGRDMYSLSCRDNDLAWFVDHDGVSTVAGGKRSKLAPIKGVRPYSLTRIAVGPDHSVYATVSGTAANGGGVWQYKDRAWTQLPGDGMLGRSAPMLYVDSRNRVWVGFRNRQVLLYEGGRPQVITTGNPGLGFVFAILETSRGLFAGGSGLGVFRETQFVPLTFADPDVVRGVRGLVESRSGDLWLNTARGIVRLPASELDAGLATVSYAMKADLITEGEYAGSPQQIEGLTETAARDADGHLWFATRHGVVSLDPERWRTAVHPPVVTIRSITVDGQGVAESGVVDPGPRTLVIQYQGVNLTAPDNVIFRYQLAGFDEGWQEAGRRTETIYTRVPPGTYTFKLTASNGDGRWTDPVSSRPFTILPYFYQTRGFAVAVVAATLLLLLVAYRIRVQQLSRMMSVRLNERLAERTRVARELHDTLLQTVQGSKLVADRALKDRQDADRLVRSLEQISTWLGQAAAEGRAALQSLRSPSAEHSNLAAAFQRAIDECQHDSEAAMPFSVHGRARELHPVVGDEIYRIGYEAIRNACHHAQATRISVTLEYAQDLTLQITDDGVGIDIGVLETGKDGHFGLRGMRERAERISATLTVASSAATGTAITLTVPGQVAFRLA